ncbi:hypothetical protein BVC80_9065g98 [Macleaya cordata]|uniref:Uncharacterized protein n=1 Tax=Macleaya cordata TaxID=56857 RepID=A0A200PNP6_MACCD|nr:hypothetical protein BVC80_9065g98 [Macleaya cordata]
MANTIIKFSIAFVLIFSHEIPSVEAGRHLKSSSSSSLGKKQDCKNIKCIPNTTTENNLQQLSIGTVNTNNNNKQRIEEEEEEEEAGKNMMMSSEEEVRRDLMSDINVDGYKEKDFRPTTPGHSPGVGHSVQTPNK